MKLQEFEQHYKHLCSLVDSVLIRKRAEYADTEDDGDRLKNFKKATSTFGTNPLMICLYYASKHWESLEDIAENIDRGIYPTQELLDEKFQDMSAYMVLGYACAIEELEAYNRTRHNSHGEALQGASDPKNDIHTVSEPKVAQNASDEPTEPFIEYPGNEESVHALTRSLEI